MSWSYSPWSLCAFPGSLSILNLLLIANIIAGMPYAGYIPPLYSFLCLYIMVNIHNIEIKQVCIYFLIFSSNFLASFIFAYKQLKKNFLYAAWMSPIVQDTQQDHTSNKIKWPEMSWANNL